MTESKQADTYAELMKLREQQKEITAKIGELIDGCMHSGWSFATQGRVCFACHKFVVDFGD